jgi:hypothetical protein
MKEPTLFGGIGARRGPADPTTARFKRVVFFGVLLGVAAFVWNRMNPPEELTVVRVDFSVTPEAPEAPAPPAAVP